MMKIDYTGKVVVITGAAGGIGSVMAEEFAALGAKVAICDIGFKPETEEMLKRIREKGGVAETFKMDVTNRQTLPETAQAIVDTFGKIDVLINNAGVNVKAEDRFSIENFAEKNWDWITSVDLDGVYNVSKAILPHMIAGGGGNVINITSVVGLVPFRKQCAFAAAKAGVANLTKAMAIELAEKNIRVNAIAPGSIMFEGTRALFYNDAAKAEAMLVNIPQHRAGDPTDVAYAALYLASDYAGYVTGAILKVDGGWTCGFARDF